MIDLDRIDEYCSKATEGPWELHRAAFVFDSEGICVADCRWRDIDDESVANADFIAKARMGRQGKVDFLFDGDRQTFTLISQRTT